jgi:N-methylhydantoinase A
VLGVDIGGTFTDFVWARGDGTLVIGKVPSSPQDPSRSFLQGLVELGVPADEEIVHGCTVATNAVLERKGARTALVTTQGFADVIEIGRQTRPQLYALHVRRPEPLVPRDLRFEVVERVTAEGVVFIPLDEAVLEQVAKRLEASGAESVAVSLLFSFLHPEHERRVREAIVQAGGPRWVSLSSEVLPEFREYERTSTTVLNAYVAPVMARYLERLTAELPNPVRIMASSGGSLTVPQAKALPVQTLLSGPAGGVVGAFAVAQAAGFDQVITFDMGGTSTDVSLCPGRIQQAAEAVIEGFPVRVPMADIQTVGAGGGSIAYLDPGGALAVGPESAGADPGPAAYGVGVRPTVTDANIVLGHLPAALPLAGRIALDAEAARCTLASLNAIGGDVQAAAQGIVRIANANMERALRSVSVERGHDPRDFTLVAFGGAGPLHACELAEAVGIPRVLVPRYPGVLSALGMVLADVVRDYAHTAMLDGADATAERLEELFKPLEEQARADLQEAGFRGGDIMLLRSADLRYRGQGYEITTPLRDDGLSLFERFHRLHQQRYGHSHPERPVEVVTLRLRAVGRVPSPKLDEADEEGPDASNAVADHTELAEPDGTVRAPLYARERLRPGNRFHGPAVVTQTDATTYVPRGWTARVDRWFNLILEMDAGPEAGPVQFGLDAALMQIEPGASGQRDIAENHDRYLADHCLAEGH